MKQRKTVRRQLLSLALISLFLIPLLPLAGSDTPPGTPYYVYGFVEDEGGPVSGAVVNLTLSSGGVVVAWNETTTDANGLYIALFQSANVGDVITGRVSGVTNNLPVDGGPGGWLNFTYTHLEYTLSPGWNLISMGLLTNTLASDITSQTSTCLFIVNWSAEAKAYTQVHTKGSTEDDFTLVDGYGYWAYAETIETFNITGVEKTGPKTYTLAPGGWNLIGWTDNTTTTTASELCNIVNDTYYGGVRGYITPWNTSQQEYDNGYLESSLFPPGAFPDITIQRQQGYWMWVSTATSWTPDPQPPEWSPDIRLTDVGGWGAHYPDIAVSGNFVHVVWENSSDRQIWHHRSPDLGVTWDVPRQISNTPDGEGTFSPRVVANGSQVYVFWEDTRDPAVGEVYMARSTNDGESWTSTDVRISNNDGYRSGVPKAAVWGDTVYVVWFDEYFRSIEGRPEAFFSRSDDRGASWSTPVNITSNDGFSSSPKSMCVYEDTVHVVFNDYRSGNWEAYYKRSSDRGETWTNAIPVSLIDGYNSLVSSIACDGTTLHVVWRDDIDVPGQEIYYARSTTNGDTWSTPTRLSHDDEFIGEQAYVAVSGDTVHVVWVDYMHRTFTGDGDIHYNVSLDGGSTWLSEPTRLTSSISCSYSPSLAIDMNENLHIVWYDNRTGTYEIYHKRSPGWI